MGKKLELEAFHAEEYQAGIFVAKVISFLGWCVAGIGLFALVVAMDSLADAGEGVFSPLFLLPSLGTIIGGLLIVASGQASRAIFDGANDARRILIVSTEILDEVNANQALTE